MDKDENREETKRKIEVMKAYLEGKTIQYRVKYIKDDVWEDEKYPSWSWYSVDYRVKPDETKEQDEPKKLMTNRQLAELMAKGYGQWCFDNNNPYLFTNRSHNLSFNNKEVSDNILIMPWDSDEFIKPTVDIYEEFMGRRDKGPQEEEEIIRDYSNAGYREAVPSIGERFMYKGKLYECIECNDCDKCTFNDDSCLPFNCSERKDGRHVVFVAVSKKESVGVHRRTPQEIADFFNCYVAMDKDGEWFLYSEEPRLERYSWASSKGLICLMDNLGFLSFILATENHNWRTLYRPHQEPIVNEEEEDDD